MDKRKAEAASVQETAASPQTVAGNAYRPPGPGAVRGRDAGGSGAETSACAPGIEGWRAHWQSCRDRRVGRRKAMMMASCPGPRVVEGGLAGPIFRLAAEVRLHRFRTVVGLIR